MYWYRSSTNLNIYSTCAEMSKLWMGKPWCLRMPISKHIYIYRYCECFGLGDIFLIISMLTPSGLTNRKPIHFAVAICHARWCRTGQKKNTRPAFTMRFTLIRQCILQYNNKCGKAAADLLEINWTKLVIEIPGSKFLMRLPRLRIVCDFDNIFAHTLSCI